MSNTDLTPHMPASAPDKARLLDLPVWRRPREKLRLFGGTALSDRELLCIILGSASRYESVNQVCGELLDGRSLNGLASLGLGELEAQRGIGVAGACRIVATLEIGRRLALGEIPLRQPLTEPEQVVAMMRVRMLQEDRESVYVLALDSRRRLIGERCVSIGSLGAAILHPREVFRAALGLAAAALILVHNHPSGDPTPSLEDQQVTYRIQEAGQVLGVTVVDHIIVAAEGYTSFRQQGWLC